MAIRRRELIACRFAETCSTLSDLERCRASARASARGVCLRGPGEPADWIGGEWHCDATEVLGMQSEGSAMRKTWNIESGVRRNIAPITRPTRSKSRSASDAEAGRKSCRIFGAGSHASTESPGKSTKACWQSRAGCAASAGSRHKSRCASIIPTPPAGCEGCSAASATPRSALMTTMQTCWLRRSPISGKPLPKHETCRGGTKNHCPRPSPGLPARESTRGLSQNDTRRPGQAQLPQTCLRSGSSADVRDCEVEQT
jgi:hypothetical protein